MHKTWLLGPTTLVFLCATVPAVAVSKVTFLGTDPQYVAASPVSPADLAGGAVDAAGNGYFADGHAGTVTRVAPDGTQRVLLSGLKQPHLAVNYRGDLAVADTGNNRLLLLAAGGSAPVVRGNIPAPGSVVVDNESNLFYLRGSSLWELDRNGNNRGIGDFAGAVMLAYGPASGENETIYVLQGQAGGKYSISTFSYHNTTGQIAAGRGFQTPDLIEGFGVDAAGNLILAGVQAGSKTHLFEISTSGSLLALTAPVSGTNVRMALDPDRTVYYIDAQGIFQFMKGTVDFGTASQQGGSGTPNVRNLTFALPTGVAVASTSYVVDGHQSQDFTDNFPNGANCSPGSSLCDIPISYFPQDLGITGALLSLLDANGKVLVQVPLHGVGSYPLHQLYVPFGTATAYPATSTSLKSPAGICNSSSLGPMVADVGLGSVVTPYSGAFSMTGLGRPETVAHVPGGNTYATQAGMPGVLVIHPDGTKSRIAERLATEPNGVAVDGAGNVFISDRNTIFRVGADGIEEALAYPATDNGYTWVQSIAVDLAGDVYAFFGAGGPSGNGGLLKISATGGIAAIPTDATSAAGLAVDSGGGLYFSDSVHKQLESQRTDGSWITMLTGLKTPRGVTALYGPLVIDQGAAQIVGASLPASALDFGNVPVGTTATKTLTVFALGNAETRGQVAFDGRDSAFSAGNGYVIEAGGSQTVTISFTPTYPGPHSSQLYDSANDYYSSYPYVSRYAVKGTGITGAAARKQ